jgi:hypothetical protein
MRYVPHALAGCAVVLAIGWFGGPGAAPGADASSARRAAAGPAFTFSASRLGPSTRRRVTGSSWHRGCPVALADLRLVRVGYWGFDRRPPSATDYQHFSATGR